MHMSFTTLRVSTLVLFNFIVVFFLYIPRGAGPTEDAPVSVAMHSFGGNMVVLALCRDMHLRLWATEVGNHILVCVLLPDTYMFPLCSQLSVS